MQTIVKKWFQDKEFGFLENGKGPDILVRKAELLKCSYLKVGAVVEFECHTDNKGLIAKRVSLLRKKNTQHNKQREPKKFHFGVMT